MMKTIFDKPTRDELITRINSLSENSAAQWGKMNVHQMLKHGALCDEMYLGKTQFKRAFIGRLFGKMALNASLKNDAPLRRSTPTLPSLIIAETTGDLQAEKNRWISIIGEYADYSKPEFVHTFFGKMTREQLGYMAYKHIDHHLRQFNC